MRHAVPLAASIDTVVQDARSDLFDFRDVDIVECLQLRCEDNAATQARLVQRLDAERVTSGNHPLRRHEDECEHSVQPGNPPRLVRPEKVQDGLAVAVGLESTLSENCPQFGMVVNLAIGDE